MASSQPHRSAAERAQRLRALAEGTYRLADECDCPAIIDDYLRIAAKLIGLAEGAEAEAAAMAAPKKPATKAKPAGKACSEDHSDDRLRAHA